MDYTREYNEFWDDYGKVEWEKLCERYFPVMEDSEDKISAEDREYYNRPYNQRHRRHLIHCWKVSILNRLKGKGSN